jgi:hypothetical protein
MSTFTIDFGASVVISLPAPAPELVETTAPRAAPIETAVSAEIVPLPVARKRGRPAGSKKAGATFRGFDDFVPAFNAARYAAIAMHGENWWLRPEACLKARLPRAWAKCVGKYHSSKGLRDVNFPVARFWPNGMLPAGPEYATDDAAEQPFAIAA